MRVDMFVCHSGSGLFLGIHEAELALEAVLFRIDCVS